MPGPPETTSGFLLGVRDCCLALASDIKVPGPIIEEIGRRGGLDPVSLQQLRLEQRLIKDLITQLKSHFVDDRQRAAQALGGIGPAAADAVPALADALKDRDVDDVPRSAAVALRKIGPAAVPVLADALKDQDAGVRRSATGALGGIGPAAAAAVPVLADALKDQAADVRWSAAVALGKIGPAAAAALIDALKDQAADVRELAAEALGEIRQLMVGDR